MKKTNVALHKGVLARGGNPLAITDGCSLSKSYWDGGAAPTSALIDLGGYYDIDSLRLVTYYGDGRYYHYEIFASADGSEYTKIAGKSDDSEATAEGVTHSFAALTARYIRILMTYNSDNPSCHITECEVFGTENLAYQPNAAGKTDADPSNIALHKPCRTNSNQTFAFLCTDGSDSLSWIGEDYPRYCDVDLLENYYLQSVSLSFPEGITYGFAIYTSLDGVKYDFALRSSAKGGNGCELKFDKITEARIIRVVILSTDEGPGGSPAISEIRAKGERSGSAIIPTRKTLEFESYHDWLLRTRGIDSEKQPLYSADDTVKALQGLVFRVLGKRYVSCFDFIIEASGKQYAELYSENGRLTIKADCGVSAAAGLNHYLKYYCNVEVSQQTKQVKMPDVLPVVDKPVVITSPYEVRYAYNYCTLSYTMPFFGYEDWQKELDYLFLSGVNLILDTTATEALWVHFLQKLGYTADEAKDYICGYCYKAWWLMGNLEGTGGSVSDSWVKDTLEMARANQRYMTVMGAYPALQTFVGAMPSTFGRLAKKHLIDKGFADVSEYMAPQGSWAGGFTRPNVLKTSYDGYSYIAEEFYKSQDFIYGHPTHYFCGDVCHEGGIVPEDLSKPQMAGKILDELLKSDSESRWILQAWWDNPMKETLDGFGDKKASNIIILDLAALAKPRFSNETTWGGREFGGCGWIYCNLNNYGGRTGMHGKLAKMSELIADANRSSSLMKGIGITPEGTFDNPVMWELFWEMGWRDEPVDIDKWIKGYCRRRYGIVSETAEKAWAIFEKTVYGIESYDGTTKNNVINENASIKEGYCVGGYYKIPYSRSEFEKGVSLLMENTDALIDSETFVYDAVDFMRQLLTNASDDIFETLKETAKNRDLQGFSSAKAQFLRAMILINELCGYSEDDRMGRWIGRALDFTRNDIFGYYDDYSKDMMKINCKALVTTWASSPITNYANRQYEGLMTDYFYAMWKELLNKAECDMIEGREPTLELGRKRCFDIGWNMVINGKDYNIPLSDPKGDGNSRPLKAIWEEIRRDYVSRDTINVVKGADEVFESEALKAQSKQK